MPDMKDLEGGSLVPKQGVLKKKELDDVTIVRDRHYFAHELISCCNSYRKYGLQKQLGF